MGPGVLRLTAPNPGLMTGPGTNTYLVGGAEPVVIDPGPADATHTAAIVAAAAPLGPVRTILVTHTHVDHAPGAAALAAATGARIVGFGPAEDFEPDERVGEGWTLSCPGTAATGDSDVAGVPHAGPCLGPFVLARGGAGPAADRRPCHARLDRRDPPPGRGSAPVPGEPGPRPRRHARHPHAGARARAADGPRARGDRLARGPSAGAPRDHRGRPDAPWRGDGRRVAARGLRRRHRAAAPGRPVLPLGAPAGAGSGGQGRAGRRRCRRGAEDTIETRWVAA